MGARPQDGLLYVSDPATADNTAAVATFPAAASGQGMGCTVAAVWASYDAAAVGALVLKAAGVEIARWNVHNQWGMEFPIPIFVEPGKDVTLTLDGVASTGGECGMIGYIK